MNPTFEATATFVPLPGVSPEPRPSQLPGWLRLLLPVQRIPADLRDRSTGLYNRAGLFGAANDLLRLRADPVAATMIVLDFSDLSEVCDIYGHAIAVKVIARIVRRVRSVAGARGVAGRTGPAQFTIVIPQVGEKALRRVQRGLGKPARIEFDAGDSEIVLVPDMLIDTAEPGVEGAQDLYRQMCRELARIQKDERRRLNWLTSERERHSRPMSYAPH